MTIPELKLTKHMVVRAYRGESLFCRPISISRLREAEIITDDDG